MNSSFWKDRVVRVAFLISVSAHCMALTVARRGFSTISSPNRVDSFVVKMGSARAPLQETVSNSPILARKNAQTAATRRDQIKRAELPKKRQPAESSERPASVCDQPSVKAEHIPDRIAKRSALLENSSASAPSPGQSGRSPTGGGAEDDYLSLVRQRIEDVKSYPVKARINKIEGTVVVRFCLERDGSVSRVNIVRSSLFTTLDWEAEATIRNAAPFPPIPDEICRESWEIQVPISFEIITRKERIGS